VLQRIAHSCCLLLTWLAYAYLGFLLALLMLNVLPHIIIFILAGTPPRNWLLRPFLVTVHNAPPSGSGPLLRFAPQLIQVVFLTALLALAELLSGEFFQRWLYFAGLWIILDWVGNVALLIRWQYGPLDRLLAHLGLAGSRIQEWKWPIGIGLTVLLFFLGRVLVRRLLPKAAGGGGPARAIRWLDTLFIALPVACIVWGALRENFWGARGIQLIVLLAALFSIAMAVSGTRNISLEFSSAPGRNPGGFVAVLFALLCFVGLWAAPALELAWADSHLSHYDSAHYDIRYDSTAFSLPSIQSLAAAHEDILAAEAARLGSPENSLHLKLVLYKDFDALRDVTHDFSPYGVRGMTIRAVLAGYVTHLDPAADAAALLDARWGRPGSQLLGRWVARWLSQEWEDHSLDSSSAEIARGQDMYPLAALLEGLPDAEISPLAREPLGAAWIGWVRQHYGLGAVRRLYSLKSEDVNIQAVAASLGTSPNALESAWQTWLGQLESKFPAGPAKTAVSGPASFFRGVSFSSESWGTGGGGYASRAAAEQIRRLHDIGADSIALVPYGFTSGPPFIRVSYTHTDESDEDISEATWVAHRLGMKVMLKPQLWLRDDRFTGRIRFSSEAARRRWLASYREFILHYARLAQLEHIDLLCIGTELSGVSSDTAAWRAIIADMRRIYLGPLTYAAFWNGEVDHVRFWSALDFIGVDNYFPLANQPSNRAADLLPGAKVLARNFAELSARWHRPILFTEIGYPSVRTAAVEPWSEDPARGIDDASQAACYEAAFGAFVGQPWLKGMFWWKWPSNGQGGGAQDGSYTPFGKPAAQVIRAWYLRLAAKPAANPGR
jgi:Glycoside Hydrolase Family 113